jgi:hypothetical protein
MGDFNTDLPAIILLIRRFFKAKNIFKAEFSGSAIMENIQHIMKEYRQADFERRLHMFLTYPSLRSQFSEIDYREMPVMCPGFFKPQQKVFKVSCSFGFILPWVGGLLKRCCYLLSDK